MSYITHELSRRKKYTFPKYKKNKWVKVSFKIEKRRKIEDHSVKVKDLFDICVVKEKKGLFHTLSTFYMTNCLEQSLSNKVLI